MLQLAKSLCSTFSEQKNYFCHGIKNFLLHCYFIKRSLVIFFHIFESARIIFSFPCRKWLGTTRTVFWTLIGLILQGRGSRRIIRKHKMVSCWVLYLALHYQRQHDDKYNKLLSIKLFLFWIVALEPILAVEMTSCHIWNHMESICKRGPFRLKAQIG